MQFQINKKKYELKDSWFDITLADAVSLTETDDKIKQLEILSNCPLTVLEATDETHIDVLYDIIEDYINAIYKIDIENYPVVGLKKYKHKGVMYYLPKGAEINGSYLPFTCEPAYNIIEAQEVLKHINDLETKGIQIMSLFCAIYLKEREGIISDMDIERRAIAFRDLPMFVVWEVFFCIHFSIMNYFVEIRFCSKKEKKLKEKIIGYLSSQKPELQEN